MSVHWHVSAVAASVFAVASISLGQPSPLALARTIAGRVIQETDLSLRPVPATGLPGLQTIDLSSMFGRSMSSAAYASSSITSDRDTTIRFGVSHDCPLQIWVNGATVFERPSGRPMLFREIGYGLFRFNDTMTVPLRKGENRILVKGALSGPTNVVHLKELGSPNAAGTARFDLRSMLPGVTGSSWLYAGPFLSKNDAYQEHFPPETSFAVSYGAGDGIVVWKLAPIPLVSELAIRPRAVYTRESYAEWMYPNGTVLLSLLNLSAATGDGTYEKFVEQVCEFTLSNLTLFEYQYERLHAHRGANYRIFRRAMLDDTGAPVLPYVELLPRLKDKRLRSLVDTMAAYVSNGQVRLSDGTLCRYEPQPRTVWADDLFMSVPFLLRMGEQTGVKKYFDDAAKQIISFNRYLVDSTSGLYRHGYYDFARKKSPIAWGRANGWVVWAHSEALLHLPKDHPSYGALIALFRQHMEALVAVQGSSGLWHQLLEKPDSFEETSCTAMFMIGLARGIRLGILDESFMQPLRKGWKGLQTRISESGVVKDICRGTEIGNDPAYYLARERFDNDPRGLGAVITALVEVDPLLK